MTSDIDFTALLTDAPPPAAWTKANQARGTIAAQVGVEVATWTARTRSAKVMVRDARRLDRAVEALDHLPEAGEYWHCVVGGEFRGFDLLPAMLKLAKSERFDGLTLTTLGFSRDNLEDLGGMVEAKRIDPATLRILASDFFRRSDRDVWAHGAEQAKRLGYGFRSTRNHTKLILAAIVGKSFVVESSANLRSCANLEQFCITQSKALFDFHVEWIAAVWPTAQD